MPSPPSVLVALRYDCGLVRPRKGWWRDGHLLAAIVAALPVWLLMAATLRHSMQTPATWWAWLSLLAVQPLLEECVFRGVLQGALLRQCADRRLGPVTLANLLTTTLFVALHLFNQPLLWALGVAGPSLVFGHLRERLHSLWPAVLTHAYYNLGFALVAWWGQVCGGTQTPPIQFYRLI